MERSARNDVRSILVFCPQLKERRCILSKLEIGKLTYLENLEEERLSLQNLEGFYIDQEERLGSEEDILLEEKEELASPGPKKKPAAKKTTFKERRLQLIKEAWDRVSRFSSEELALLRKVKRVNWTIHEDMMLLLHPKDYCLNVANLNRSPEAIKRRLQRLKKAGLSKKY